MVVVEIVEVEEIVVVSSAAVGSPNLTQVVNCSRISRSYLSTAVGASKSGEPLLSMFQL